MLWTQFHAYSHSDSQGVKRAVVQIYSFGLADVWRRSHRSHHAHTNIVERDVDIPLYESIAKTPWGIWVIPYTLVRELVPHARKDDVELLYAAIGLLRHWRFTAWEIAGFSLVLSAYVGWTFGVTHLVKKRLHCRALRRF